MARLEPGHVIAGRYRLTGALGRGGMGAVYLAIQEPLGREVALKVLNPDLASSAEARERFLREARAVSRLNHPNVVTVHDFGADDDGTLYLVMERVRGRPLRARMDEAGPLPPAVALALLVDACRGVAAAHRAGIVHGDLKPENLLISDDEDRRVKVLDFGLARLRTTDASASRLTQDGQILGTPIYIAPEQVRGVRDDPASDVYAMGVMLYEMLTGKPPFDDANPALLLVKHITEAPVPPGVKLGYPLPEDLDSLVMALLAKEPTARPRDGAALLALLSDRASRLAAHSTVAAAFEATASGDVVAPPMGKITLVFTDVESSSSLWERAPSVMRDALRVHDDVLRRTLREESGYEVKTQGDSFMVAFKDLEHAVRFCAKTQAALLDAPWSDALLAEPEARQVDVDGRTLYRGLRVRMGLYCGEPDCRADPVNGRMDYFGPMVNRAARVESAAWGGQILFGVDDGATTPALPNDVAPKDHGPARLKGIDTLIRLVELVPPAVATRAFPPPRALEEKTPHNLPGERTSLVGRDALVDDVVARLGDETRVITLTGLAGVGKSRVALRAAHTLVEQNAFPGGVYLISLADQRDVLAVLARVARAFDVTLLHADSPERAAAQLGTVLKNRGRTLLVLDDVDRTASVVAGLVDVWIDASEARVLITGRAPVPVKGGVVVDVAPLDDAAARELFVARARDAGVTLSESDDEAVQALTRALDGLPLALELAASRARVIRPQKLVERLAQRFDLLKGSQGAGRSATLRGALDLSWEMLSPVERSALAQCAVFRGGFSLEMAESVIDVSAIDDTAFILDVLEGLREKSLLKTVHSEEVEELRFVLYESVKAYAGEQQAALVDTAELARRFARTVVEAGELEAANLHTPRAEGAVSRLSVEAPHLHAVASSSADAFAIRAALVLAALYGVRGPVAAHRALVDDASARALRHGDEPLLLKTLLVRGRFEAISGDPKVGKQSLEHAATLARSVGDEISLAFALQALVRAEIRILDVKAAHAIMAEALPLAERLEHPRLLALLWNERMLFNFSPTVNDSREAYGKALAYAARAGDRELEGRIESNLGIVMSFKGQPAEGLKHLEKALVLAREVCSRPLEGMVLGNMGGAHGMNGELEEAVALLEQALVIHEEVGNRLLVAADGSNLAAACLVTGRFARAEEVVEISLAESVPLNALRERASATLWKCLLLLRTGDVDAARAVLTPLRDVGLTMPHLGLTEMFELYAAICDATAAEGTDAHRAALAVVDERIAVAVRTSTLAVKYGLLAAKVLMGLRGWPERPSLTDL